jgi:hypothetical protein
MKYETTKNESAEKIEHTKNYRRSSTEIREASSEREVAKSRIHETAVAMKCIDVICIAFSFPSNTIRANMRIIFS